MALPRDVTLSILYALPLVVAAQRLRSVETLLAAGGTSLAYLGAALLQAVSPSAAVIRASILLVVGALCYLLARRIEETRRARAEAEAARAELQSFLGMVAHDLRGPLTTVTMTSQLLTMDDATDAARERAAGLLQPEVNRMQRLVGDLADAARIGAGTFSVEVRREDCAAIVRRVVDGQRLASHGREIELDVPETLEVACDPDRLAQVLNNLVSNAVKYSRANDKVSVELRKVGDHVEIRVSDQGPGIDPADLERLFKPFSRLASGNRKPGLGLGLYIVDAIVRAHGGRVWAQSPGTGRGSTFTVELPVARTGAAGKGGSRTSTAR